MDRFAKLRAYLRTLRQYTCNAKGRHDILDYGRALFYILLTVLVLWKLLAKGS